VNLNDFNDLQLFTGSHLIVAVAVFIADLMDTAARLVECRLIEARLSSCHHWSAGQ